MKVENFPESLKVQDDHLVACLNSIKEKVKILWYSQLLPHYTKHGVDHSERIIERLGELLEDYPNLLNKYERFILLASAYLHDIGMQSPRHAGLDPNSKEPYSIEELEIIREKHNEASAKMIRDSISEKASKLSLGLNEPEECKRCAKFIATLSRYHRKLKIEINEEVKDTSLAGKDIKLPLLIALLRLGDELDQDYRRVNMEILKLRDIPVESKFYWWSHHFVSSIPVREGKIKLYFTFPEESRGDEVIEVFRNKVCESVQKQLDEVYDILYDYGIRLHSEVRIGEENYEPEGVLELIPDDLSEHINENILKMKRITSKFFKVFEKEIISKDSEYKWTERRIREQRPSWKDFAAKRIAVPQHLLDEVLKYLEQKKICIVVGGKDTGKTWLSYAVGYNLLKQEKNVMYASVDGKFNGEAAWNEIVQLELRAKNQPPVYIILEDCHTNPRESEEFFKKILDEGEENLRFLFTMRKTGKFLLEDEEPDIFYDEGTEREYIVRLLPDEMITEHVQNIIKKFIEVKEIKYEVLEKELEDVAQKWGNDLYWVWLRLNSWNYSEGQKLSDITNDAVYESIWSDRGKIKLSLPERRKILLPLSVLCQFEPLKVYELVNFLEDNRKTLIELRKEGIVSLSTWRGKNSEGKDFEYGFISVSGSFAEVILATLSRKDYSFRINGREREIQIFKDYLKSNPPNWYAVFYTLNLARKGEKSDFVKKILISLLNDVDAWEIVRENAKDILLIQMASLLDILSWIGENGKALEIKRQYTKLHYKELQDKIKELQDKIKSSSATTIRKYLPLLSHIVDINKYFEACSIFDYKHIINSSTINAVRLLFIDFQEWKLYSATKGMIEALLDTDLARLVQESTSLYRLGGLIKEVKQADVSAATKFVEKLSEIDLNELFSRNDPDAEREGLTKERVVNYFLRKRISFALPHGWRIVNKIRDDVWNSLIYSASPKDGFWLLWNIYRNSEDKAKHLVQNNIGQFLLKTCDDEFFRMALIGLLHLCDFEIKNIRLPKIDVRGLLENELHKENPSNTRIVLSLIALRVKLPPSSFQFFDIIKYTKERVNSIPDDPQLKELLQKLIDTYL